MNSFSLWHFIILGCVVYVAYLIFRGIWKLLRSRKPSAPTASKETELIINAYGKALEHLAPTPGTVADESKLPFSKPQIKAAILIALKETNDMHQKKILKFAFVQLADFQPDIGSKNIGLDFSGVDVARLSDPDLLALANSATASEKSIANSNREAKQLAAELSAAGF